MADSNLNINLKLNDQASESLKKTEKNLESFASKARKNFVAIAAQIYVAQQAVKAFASALEAVEAGARISQQEESFKNLAKSVGASSNQIIADLRRMSGETLSTSEIISSASRAIVLGLDPSQLGRLMEISRASARAFGTDVTEMFDSITLGIGRQSKMILDNLGIIVDAEAAYSKYASQLGKAAEDLSDAERRQAFLNEVLEAGGDIISKVNIGGKSQLEIIQSLKATWKDFSGEIGKALSNFGLIKESITVLTTALDFYSKKLKEANEATNASSKGKSFNNQLEFMVAQAEAINKKISEEQKRLSRQLFGTEKTEERINELLIQRSRLFATINEMKQKEVDLGTISIVQNKEELDRLRQREEDLRKFYDLKRILENEDRLQFEANLQSNMALMKTWQDIQMQAFSTITQLYANALATFNQGLASTISSIVRGAKSAKEAFAEFGEQMIKVIVDFLAQKAVAFAISKTLGAAMQGFLNIMAIQLAAAWAPAAALASLATLGANAAPAQAGLTSTVGLAQALALPRAFGGDDLVSKPTLFMAGERGPERIITQPIDGRADLGGGGGGGGITIQIFAQSIGSPREVRSIAQEIGLELERESRYARGI